MGMRETDERPMGSSLSRDDWFELLRVFRPFIVTTNSTSVEIGPLPPHLEDHELVEHLARYKETGDMTHLDRAGQILCPTGEPFGWYVPITKM